MRWRECWHGVWWDETRQRLGVRWQRGKGLTPLSNGVSLLLAGRVPDQKAVSAPTPCHRSPKPGGVASGLWPDEEGARLAARKKRTKLRWRWKIPATLVCVKLVPPGGTPRLYGPSSIAAPAEGGQAGCPPLQRSWYDARPHPCPLPRGEGESSSASLRSLRSLAATSVPEILFTTAGKFSSGRGTVQTR